MSARRIEILVGESYGHLVVVCELAVRRRASGGTERWVLCRCVCGKEIEVRLSNVRTGHTRSCGCRMWSVGDRNEAISHKFREFPEYRIWKGMKERCYSPSRREYSNYGGRGIRVCERWRKSFMAFYADMGPRPSFAHSIDRIDGNGDYEPGNCRWATRAEQNRNRKDNRFLEFNGERLCLADWAKRFGMRKGTLHDRLARGMSVREALTTPVRQWRTDEAFLETRAVGRTAAWYRDLARRHLDESLTR